MHGGPLVVLQHRTRDGFHSGSGEPTVCLEGTQHGFESVEDNPSHRALFHDSEGTVRDPWSTAVVVRIQHVGGQEARGGWDLVGMIASGPLGISSRQGPSSRQGKGCTNTPPGAQDQQQGKEERSTGRWTPVWRLRRDGRPLPARPRFISRGKPAGTEAALPQPGAAGEAVVMRSVSFTSCSEQDSAAV